MMTRVEKKLKVKFPVILLALTMIFLLTREAAAAPLPAVDFSITPSDSPDQVVDSVKLLVLLTLLSMAPAFLIMMTSFTRIVIVLSLLRTALGVPAAPANQIIVGLTLFLTIFIMAPTYKQVNEQAVQPYLRNEISQQEAQVIGARPLSDFMLRQTREKDLALFINLAKIEQPNTPEDVPIHVVIPSFVISELKTAFEIGFLLFIPFLIIDMVVASILMSMGMFMLPPVMIALPFKLLLFVMVDGWYLVVKSLVESFR
jgi:flagellar biosynthetic protein FliP